MHSLDSGSYEPVTTEELKESIFTRPFSQEDRKNMGRSPFYSQDINSSYGLWDAFPELDLNSKEGPENFSAETKFVTDRIRGTDFVDLGCGRVNSGRDFAAKAGAKRYIGIDTSYITQDHVSKMPEFYIRDDMLAALSQMDNPDHVTFLASGLETTGCLAPVGSYPDNLQEEIYRNMKDGDLLICGPISTQGLIVNPRLIKIMSSGGNDRKVKFDIPLKEDYFNVFVYIKNEAVRKASEEEGCLTGLHFLGTGNDGHYFIFVRSENLEHFENPDVDMVRKTFIVDETGKKLTETFIRQSHTVDRCYLAPGEGAEIGYNIQISEDGKQIAFDLIEYKNGEKQTTRQIVPCG